MIAWLNSALANVDDAGMAVGFTLSAAWLVGVLVSALVGWGVRLAS